MDHDFIQATQIRHLKKQEPDFRDEFWQQVPDMRSTVAREYPATFTRCRFDHAAKKVYHAPGCDHKVGWDDEDEA
jgi:hypothetical protein